MYVLVGNQWNVALFNRENKYDSFRLKQTFRNHKFQDKDSHLFTHRAGTGKTFHTNDQETLGESHYKEELVAKFCKDIVQYMEKTTKDNKSKVIIVGGPSFIGELRKKSSKNLNKAISKEMTKNFYTEKPHELEKFLKDNQLIKST